jgi:hypothetical protein
MLNNKKQFKKNIKLVDLDVQACMILKKKRACGFISPGRVWIFFFLFVSWDNLSSIFFWFFKVRDRSPLAACNKSLTRMLLRI